MLTKEECEKALNEIETIYYDRDDSFSGLMCFGKSIEKIAKLINEHFELKEHYDYLNLKVIEQNMREMNYLIDRNNPPLKFEDLKVGMWLWDNRDKEYTHIHCYDNWHGRFWHYYCGSESPYFIYKDEFEENRFFLSEVKEDVD